MTDDGTRGVATSATGFGKDIYFAPGLGQNTLKSISQRAAYSKSFWSDRDQAFADYEDIVALIDQQEEPGLESMISNSAKTLFSLARFMVATSVPQRTVAVGDQGPLSRRKAGKSERALSAWWLAVDNERMDCGEPPWQYTMAYWMCLYGWYSTLRLVTADESGAPNFIAIPYDPSECFPEFGLDGWNSFARIYDSTVGIAQQIGSKANLGDIIRGGGGGQTAKLLDWWERRDGEILYGVAMLHPREVWLRDLDVMPGLTQIPILCGPVGGTPSRSKNGWQKDLGSVLSENAVLYRDFDKWLSFLTQLAKEHARAPLLAKNVHIEEDDLSPADIRSKGAVIETDDPEADVKRIDPGRSPVDVWRLLAMIQGMEQRGGFPESAYGNIMIELSGFGISQLLQAAERRVGDQVNALSAIDARVGKFWLDTFRDNEFTPTEIEGFEGGFPSKSFIEDFRPGDVPKRYRVSTHIPIRIGSDMMSKMAIVRQAIGGQQPILDIYTALDEILGMQDPTLIMDRISEDQARMMTEPLKMAINLKLQAADLRGSRKPKANEIATMLEAFAEQMMQQQQQQTGAQPRQKIAPQNLPPEAQGISPDRVRAQMRMGPPPNQRQQPPQGAPM